MAAVTTAGRWCLVAVGLASLGGRVAAQAEPEYEVVALSFEALGVGCPTEASFREELGRRTRRLRLTGDDGVPSPAGHRSFVVVIAPEGAGFRGVLVVDEGQGTRHQRALSGSDCREVSDALNVIVAVAVDPDARTSALEPTAAPPAPDAVEAPPAPPAPAPAADAPTPPAPAAATDSRTPRAAAPPAYALSAQVEVTPPAGDPRFGAGLRGEYLGAGWSLRAGLHASVTTRDAGAAAPGVARFQWGALVADGCVRAAEPVAGHTVSVCVRLGGGALFAQGRGTGDDRSSVRPWLTGGGVAAYRGRLGAAAALDAELSVAIPVVRDRYFLAPGVLAYEVPAAVVSAAVGLALLFS